MPRKSRIDAPGALHHIIARGINRQKIFIDDRDRQNFLDRLSNLLVETKTSCYAWALIPNHIHLLLKTGRVPIHIESNTTAADRICDLFQPPKSTKRACVSKPVQIDPVPGRFVSVGAGALYSFKSFAGENGV